MTTPLIDKLIAYSGGLPFTFSGVMVTPDMQSAVGAGVAKLLAVPPPVLNVPTTPAPIIIDPRGTVKNSDAVASSLKAGAIVQFASGQTIQNAQTVEAKDGVQLVGGDVTPAVIATPAKKDGVRVTGGVKKAIIYNLTFNTTGTIGTPTAAVNDTGTGTVVDNIEQTGSGRLMTCNGAQGGTYKGLKAKGNLVADYVIWAAVDGVTKVGPSSCSWSLMDIDQGHGEHCIRIHKHTNCTFGSDTDVLRGTTFAGVINYHSVDYAGAAFTAKEGDGLKVKRLHIIGPFGLGPNDAEWPNPTNLAPLDPNWPNLRTTNATITGCLIEPGKRYVHLMAGTANALFENTVIKADPSSACISLDGPGPSADYCQKNNIDPKYIGCWPIPTATFTNCQFFGAVLIGTGDLGNIGGLKFEGCTLNGVPFTKVDPKTGLPS